MPERKRETIYQEVTDLIIAELEQGRVPWVQPWGKAKAGIGLPKNAATERSYSGINILILWGAVIEKGYTAQA
jgi:antirestriction protein ArdC